MTAYTVTVTVELTVDVDADTLEDAREAGIAAVRALPGVDVDEVLATFTRQV